MFTAQENAHSAVAAEEKPVEEVKVEKKSFDVHLVSFDAAKKLSIIKEVRSIFAIGLKEAKDLVEKAPVVLKKDVPAEAVEALKEKLTALGCSIDVK